MQENVRRFAAQIYAIGIEIYQTSPAAFAVTPDKECRRLLQRWVERLEALAKIGRKLLES